MTLIAAGVTIMWPSTAASIPSGWTRVTNMDSKHPKGTAAAVNPAVNGGAATATHVPNSHTHSLAAHTHAGNDPSGAPGQTLARTAGGVAQPNGTHTHASATTDSKTDTVGPGLGGIWDSPATDPAFYGCIFIESDGTPTSFPTGCLVWYGSATPPTGWSQHAGSVGLYIKGAAAAGNGGSTGGANTHKHTATTHDLSGSGTHTHAMTSATPTGTSNMAAGISSAGTTAHTHAITTNPPSWTADSVSPGDSSTDNSEPPYHRLQGITNAAPAAAQGLIAIWLGTLASIPTGWLLCDGSNGTPDLRGKYIKAVTSTANIGDTGGSATHTHTGAAHTHPSNHRHVQAFAGETTDAGIYTGSTGTTVPDSQHTHGAAFTSITSATSGSGTIDAPSTDGQPTFRTVAYIMAGTAFAAPTVTSATPSTGTTAGGTSVVLAGTGFAAGATVTFGGVAATGVSVDSSIQITCTAPAHAAGAVNVVVTNTDTQAGTLTNGYTYQTPAGIAAMQAIPIFRRRRDD